METVTADEWAEFCSNFHTYATEEFFTGGSKMHCVMRASGSARIIVGTVTYDAEGKAYKYEIDRSLKP